MTCSVENLFQERVIGRKFVRYPFGKSMPHFRECHLIWWQRSDFFVVHQETVGVFNLQIMRIAWFKFDDAPPGCIVHDQLERFSQQP